MRNTAFPGVLGWTSSQEKSGKLVGRVSGLEFGAERPVYFFKAEILRTYVWGKEE